MALKDYQTALNLSTLYEVARACLSGSEQIKQNIFVNSGTVNIYVSNSATQPAALANMVLMTSFTALAAGIVALDVVPRYIAIVQDTGTTTEIIASGLKVSSLGAIS